MVKVRNVSDLDFNSVKEDLKVFMQSQPEFADYNFEGAGVNAILDILAYNTHYTAFYANMISNEMFLDSAQIRSSVVSNAKLLGYTPRSNTASRAKIRLQINNVPTSVIAVDIPKGTTFTGRKDGVTYLFYTREEYFATKTGSYTVELDIFEGKEFPFKYTVNNSLEQRFEIPNKNVDVNLLEVRVQDSAGSLNSVVFNKAASVSDLDGNSTVYFLEENTSGNYEILFGDGVFGRKLTDGNVVLLSYNINTAEAPNNIGSFTLSGSINGYSNVTITTLEGSSSGSPRETKESIISLAPKAIQTQNRAITTEDYRSLLLRDYPNIIDAKVWGGEDALPVEFGKVFIALLPKENFIITNSIKEFIADSIIKPFNIATVLPVLVDPVYMDLLIDTTIYYNKNETTLQRNDLANVIRDKILTFSTQFLSRFDKTFHFSNFITDIDETEKSIVSNETSIRCRVTLDTFKNIDYKYDFYFNNPIMVGSLESSVIILSDANEYFIDDDRLGNVRLYRMASGNKLIINDKYGTINYHTGEVTLSKVNVFTGDTMSLTITPKNKNLNSVRDQILRINQQDITVTIKDN